MSHYQSDSESKVIYIYIYGTHLDRLKFNEVYELRVWLEFETNCILYSFETNPYTFETIFHVYLHGRPHAPPEAVRAAEGWELPGLL